MMNTFATDAEWYPKPGEVIDGKYRFDEMLGIGGMGGVGKATHLLRKAAVALKFMSPQVAAVPGATDRFLNEGVAASKIDNEHVVTIFDVGTFENGMPYIVMECLAGQDLDQLLEAESNRGIASVARCVHFVLQALAGLQVAHHAGIVHRDMKPSNCFVVEKDGDPDFVKLLDFGISKVEQADGSKLTQTNSVLGTPLYMAPEQARSARRADHRSDIYATSVILYELLTGSTPFVSDTGEFTELLLRIWTADPTPLKSHRPDLSDELCEAVHKGLARGPDDRYQSAFEMCEGLVPWADERSRHVVTGIRRREVVKGAATEADFGELGSRLEDGELRPIALPSQRPLASEAPRPRHANTQTFTPRTPEVEPVGETPKKLPRAVLAVVAVLGVVGLGSAVAIWVSQNDGVGDMPVPDPASASVAIPVPSATKEIVTVPDPTQDAEGSPTVQPTASASTTAKAPVKPVKPVRTKPTTTRTSPPPATTPTKNPLNLGGPKR